jgi:membrane protease YdiL (CAAX protease family)
MSTTPNTATPHLLSPAMARRSRLLLWGILLLVTTAELLTSLASVQIGMLAHALLLVGLTIYAALGSETAERRLALGLSLAPLIRLLSLALPLAELPRLAWYPIVAVPLLFATFVIIHQLRMKRADLGLKPGNLLLQLMFVGGGFGLGAAEYLILAPAPLLASFSWASLLFAGLLLAISTGFTEELIFRGVLQSLAAPALGRWAILYVSLLFAALHIGYLSVFDVVFVFAVGLAFALMVRWSGSILGVTLAHGMTNICLFLIMPYVAASQNAQLRQLSSWAIWGGSTVAFVSFAIYMVRAVALPGLRRPAQTPALAPEAVPATAALPAAVPEAIPAPAPALPTIAAEAPAPAWRSWLAAFRPAPAAVAATTEHDIRALRRSIGMTYTELAQRTALPARLLAEIEHGLRLPEPEQLRRIVVVLSGSVQAAA